MENVQYLTDKGAQLMPSSPRQLTIVDLFEEQVARTPGNIAVVMDDDILTYDQLNSLSDRLAGYLVDKYGLSETEVVIVSLERSEWLIISILGLLKAGAVYLPVDPRTPEKRMQFIKTDSRYKLLIDRQFIRTFREESHNYTGIERSRKDRATELAYIIYTSGTTGQPKGTMIEHHSLVNRLTWMQKQYQLSADDTILQKTTCSFDVSVWELLWWMIAGSKVFFLKDGQEKDPDQIISCIDRHAISVIHFVPSMLSQFLAFVENDKKAIRKLTSLQRVYASGEALTANLNRQFHTLFVGTGTRLVNLYGPTEATIDVTCFECSPGLDTIPIGKPIDNTRVYILDDQLERTDAGATGRIFLAGICLARGYLNRPELTTQRFIEDPFQPGERMYDTGDQGRWLPDGNIEYMGRIDDQVKIRGFRIELEEINHHLEALQEIGAAHVICLDEQLIAFLLFKDPAATPLDEGYEEQLRDSLAQSLPEYMIPHHFCRIDTLPLSASGKIDKQQLAAVYKETRNKDFAPGQAVELTGNTLVMAGIWAEVLGIPLTAIHPDRSFIEHGGDSISMLKVVAMCKRKGFKIGIKEFLITPYLQILDGTAMNGGNAKKTVSRTASKSATAQPTMAQPATFALSPIQQFFFDNNPQGLKFIMHASYYMHKSFDVDGIRRGLDAVLDGHDAFRLRFKRVRGTWQQYYDLDAPGYLLETGDHGERLDQCIARAIEKIDIGQGPLLYARIFFEEKRPVLFLACHHLVMDAISWKIFIDELQLNYTNNLLARKAG